MAEALHNEVVARNLALGIASPQVDVGLPIVVIKDLGGVEILAQLEVLKRLGKRYHGIAVGIIKCVVEI
jgi:hypothetical protein